MARQLDSIEAQKSDEQIGFGKIVGRSPRMLELYKNIESVAKCDDPVFIFGEHGSGKTLCAETIHENSAISETNFIRINCLSLPEKNLLDSYQGACEDSGKPHTLYLQNIEHLSDEDQSALLGALDRDHHFRLICSSSCSLLDEVRSGRFREDLYYRTHILPIDISPLRQRSKDIDLLLNYFLGKFSEEQGKHFKEFDDLSVRAFHDYHWPGNIRELENLIKGIVTLSADSDIVQSSMLPQNILSPTQDAANQNDGDAPELSSHKFFTGDDIIAIRDLEKMAIEHALKVCNGNVQEAALRLKISPATLYRKKPAL